MKQVAGSTECQVPSLQLVAEGCAPVPPQSLARQIKLAIRRRLSPRQERAFKKRTNRLANWFRTIAGRDTLPSPAVVAGAPAAALQAGDRVRVRSRQEIQATLDNWRQLKGCTFMPEMGEYCGTTQRVYRRMERFVDERDLRVKKVRGIVLLEGLRCQGTAEFGRCDRACLCFWREEWLEKIE